MKKIFVSLLAIVCLIMVLVSGVTVCNATVNPEFLAATSYISLYGESSLSYTASGTETINDFSGNSYRFSLLNPQGYMIMYSGAPSTVSSDGYVFLELDEESNSPYSYFTNRNITGDKLYAGPNEYYVRSGSVVYDTDGNSFNVGSDRYNLLVERSNEIKDSIESQSESVTSGGYTYVNYYQYFQRIRWINDEQDYCGIPTNYKGTCTFNATAILLGFYNYFYDSELLDVSFKNCAPQYRVLNTATDFDAITLDDILYLPTVTDALVTKLVRYKFPNYDTNVEGNYGAHMNSAKMALDSFFNEYHTTTKKNQYVYSSGFYEAIFGPNTVKSQIDNNKPVLLGMSIYRITDLEENESTWGPSHSVIAYGYKGTSFRIFDVNSHGNKTVSSLLILGSYLTFEYTGEHHHSTDMAFLHNSCYGTYCPCGEYTTCEHNFVNIYRNCVCYSCGQNAHSFNVIPSIFTATAHGLECFQCGYISNEEHMLKSKVGGYYCLKCNYDTTVQDEISFKDPDKFN